MALSSLKSPTVLSLISSLTALGSELPFQRSAATVAQSKQQAHLWLNLEGPSQTWEVAPLSTHLPSCLFQTSVALPHSLSVFLFLA